MFSSKFSSGFANGGEPPVLADVLHRAAVGGNKAPATFGYIITHQDGTTEQNLTALDSHAPKIMDEAAYVANALADPTTATVQVLFANCAGEVPRNRAAGIDALSASPASGSPLAAFLKAVADSVSPEPGYPQTCSWAALTYTR